MARTRLQPHTTESGKHELALWEEYMTNSSHDRLRIAVDPRLSAFLYVRSPWLPFHSHSLIYPDRKKRLQLNPETRALQEQYWRRLILAYARHRRLFTLTADDAESLTSEWREVLRNERIDRQSLNTHP